MSHTNDNLIKAFQRAASAKQDGFDYDGAHYSVLELSEVLSPIIDKRADLVVGSQFLQNCEKKFGKSYNDLTGAQSKELPALLFDSEQDYADFDHASQRATEGFVMAQQKAAHAKQSSFDFDGQSYDIKNGGAQFAEFLTARQCFEPTYQYNGQEYSTKSQMSAKEQMRTYGNLNEEVMAQKSDPITKMSMHHIANSEARSQAAASQRAHQDKMYKTLEEGVKNKTITTRAQYDSMMSKIDLDSQKIAQETKTDTFIGQFNKMEELRSACNSPQVYPRGAKFSLFELASTSNKKPAFGKPVNAFFEPDLTQKSGTLNLPNLDKKNFIEEMGHAFREKTNTYGETSQFVRDGLKDILTLNSFGFTPSAQADNYNEKGKMEYDAHKVVSPVLKDFVDGKIDSMPKVYAKIDQKRKEINEPYTLTDEAKQMTAQGYKELAQEQANIKAPEYSAVQEAPSVVQDGAKPNAPTTNASANTASSNTSAQSLPVASIVAQNQSR